MDFIATPADLLRLHEVSKQIDTNPLRLAARVAGLGNDEIESGVPTWAWVALAFGAGATLALVYGPTLRRKLGR